MRIEPLADRWGERRPGDVTRRDRLDRSQGAQVAHFDPRRFDTTRWSLVVAAGDAANPQAREALESLCRIYWAPIYTYLRRRGYEGSQAEDLTQGFFLKLVEKSTIAHARAERGRFRTFLLTALKNYLADEHDKESTLTRGGGQTFVSFDAAGADAWLEREPSHDESPDRLYDRRWATEILDRAMVRLEASAAEAGGGARFEALRPFLSSGHDVAYAEAGKRLGIGETAVRVAVHRLRRKFGELLRDEVAQTLVSPAEIDNELRELQRILRR